MLRSIVILLVAFAFAGCSEQAGVGNSNSSPANSNTADNARVSPPAANVQPTAQCKSPSSDDGRRICSILFAKVKPDDVAEKITYNEVDLNGDKKLDLVAWESSWVGQYGSRLRVLHNDNGKYKVLLERSMTWSPVILIEASSKGWRDLSFKLAGSSSPTFIKISYSGLVYAESAEVLGEFPPEGELLIGSL